MIRKRWVFKFYWLEREKTILYIGVREKDAREKATEAMYGVLRDG